MAHLVFFVMDCTDKCEDVLDAWEQAGAPGVTILESLGLARLRAAMSDDLPLLPSLNDLMGRRELHHRTLFSVIDDDDTLERLIAATQGIVGDFERPHSGLLFVVPVTRVFGLKRHG